MQTTPKSLRLHIAFLGKRNAGKSSLLNALVKQPIAIVSDTPGTTTDPVEKAMELLPIGPVVLIDTAGLDDVGELGQLRIQKTKVVLDKTDLAILACAGAWSEFEENLLRELKSRKIPVIIAMTKADIAEPDSEVCERLAKDYPLIKVSAKDPHCSDQLCRAIIDATPEELLESTTIVGDLVPEGEFAILVVPIDFEAPKGRIILPQVQTIRDLLDHHAGSIVVQTPYLQATLDNLKRPPALVITDSQAFKEVEKIVPKSIPLTSFSIAFARLKGDLSVMIQGAKAIDTLKPGDSVLIMESCTHHAQKDDIGRVKIPNWLRQYVGGDLQISHAQGQSLPDDLEKYRLVIHCGSCMFNRRSMLSRIRVCLEKQVPITNYGVVIAKMMGILDRTIAPFEALANEKE